MEKLTFNPLAVSAAQATQVSQPLPPAARSATVNRETDVLIPRAVWSNWIPSHGERAIDRPLMARERSALEARAAELSAGLRAFEREEREVVRSTLHAMLGGFRSLRESGEDAETAVEILLAVLREFPTWAIEEACMRIAQHKADADPPLDPRWAPSDAQIYQIVADLVQPHRQTLQRVQALLSAPVEIPQPQERISRAEIEAKLGREIKERQQFEDGGYAARVAADLAARKAARQAQGETSSAA